MATTNLKKVLASLAAMAADPNLTAKERIEAAALFDRMRKPGAPSANKDAADLLGIK